MLPPDSTVTTSLTVEKEKGGIGISNPSQGINIHDWECSYSSIAGNIVLRNIDTSVSTTVLSGIMNLTNLSFAFDANMRPVIGYQNASGVSSLYYYDTLTEAYNTLTLAAGSGAPRLCHDDKRDRMVLSNITDVLCFYIRDAVLYYRLQRERYQTEYQVATFTSGTVLKKVGMSTELRLLVQVTNGKLISSP